MFRNLLISFLFLSATAESAEVKPDHPSLFHSKRGIISGFKVNHLKRRVRLHGVSIHSWKKVFIRDFNEKLKHFPDDDLLIEQEKRIDLLLRRLVTKLTSDQDEKVVPVDIDSSDLTGVRVSTFKQVKADRVVFDDELAPFKELIVCTEGYCFFPEIFIEHQGIDLQWNPHYFKIGGKNHSSGALECEDFKLPFTLSLSYKTPHFDHYTHRRFLLMARIVNGQLKLRERDLSFYDPAP